MKRCNVCNKTKESADFAISRAERDGLCYTCRACANLRSAKWREAHPKAHAEWYDKNREWKREYYRQWRETHTDHLKQSYRKWARANKARINALIAKRNAIKLHATPPWVDHRAIRAIYQTAARLTASTGTPHEVDHIIPLRHPKVCGLHVPVNLQILTRDENKRKSNSILSQFVQS